VVGERSDGEIASVQCLAFDGALLRRGFWLYVWEIRTPDGRALHYVGKTGDKSSGSSQSPFDRLSKHLGSNKHNNALCRHLAKHGIDPGACVFRFRAFGPLFTVNSPADHAALCDVTSGLEKALACAIAEAGYEVINTVRCRIVPEEELFARVWAGFAPHFPSVT
jgi:hypothetical protein